MAMIISRFQWTLQWVKKSEKKLKAVVVVKLKADEMTHCWNKSTTESAE
jgi:hypothetical protein